jgi:phosphoserine aminotransferase
MDTPRKHNFFAGPAVLPVSVIKKAQEALWNFAGTGAGILEVSHRDKAFDAVLEGCKARAKRLYNVPEDYEVIFVQGGASMIMAMISMNFIHEGDKAQFIDTGTWASRAIKEAKRSKGNVEVLWSGKDINYTQLPDLSTLKFADDACLVHLCANNTIRGTEYPEFPKTKAPLFCDMSSDFFSRPINVKDFAFIYGGVQKNLGPAGCALCIVRKDLLARVPENLSEMLSFRKYVEENSIYNTPPVFVIYMVDLAFQWLEEEIGGLENMHKINLEKAGLLYDVFDNSDGFYRPTVTVKEHRSLMNITFRLPSEELETKILAEAKTHGFLGLKGHRSVGGLRASTYNACPTESVRLLSEFLVKFAKENR